MQMNLRINDPN